MSDIWFDFLNADQRIKVSEEMMIEPIPLDRTAENQWGHNGIGVVCLGSEMDMWRIKRKHRSDMISSISRRLPIWC